MNELDKKENYTNQTFEDIKHILQFKLEKFWHYCTVFKLIRVNILLDL